MSVKSNLEVNGTRNCLVNDILLNIMKIGWMDLKMIKLNCLTLGEL